MSDFWNNYIINILATLGATLGAVAVLGMVVLCGRASTCVDMSQAGYEMGEMVEFRCGGGGQVVGVYGSNNGLINLEPEFKYRVRYQTANGVKSTTFEDWELESK